MTVRHFPGKGQQLPAYHHFIASAKPHHTWCAFIDIDEFIVLKRHRDIKTLLRERCRRGALSLNWYVFGSGGEREYRPEPVLKRFQRRGATVNRHVKSIVKLADTERMRDPHSPILVAGTSQRDTSGREFAGPFNPNGPDDVAVVHHYFAKSLGEFKAKRLRGRSDTTLIRSMAEFAEHDENDVVDASAWDLSVR